MSVIGEKVEKLKKLDENNRTKVIQLEQQEKTATEELEETLLELKEVGIKKEELDSAVANLQEELDTIINKLNAQIGVSA